MTDTALAGFLPEFSAGRSTDAYRFLGCHQAVRDGSDGCVFRVWAPHARSVRTVGSFNGWDLSSPVMDRLPGGIWERFIPGVQVYDSYKFYIERPDGSFVFRADPFAFHAATRPETDSKVFHTDGFCWTDGPYLAKRQKEDPRRQPVNIYEVHLGSWRTRPDCSPLPYAEAARRLADYAVDMGYTHIELLPITEYPYDPSWGYQVTGWFAPTSRYGTPHDFMEFVDICHSKGIGVILDWVGAHFPRDEHGLFEFDGGCCYESEDSLMRDHPEWGTRQFDYGRPEVRSFLTSSVLFWLETYHIDGIRADAVASMLYLDYGRQGGQWRPNREGGNIDLDAVAFLQQMNTAVAAFDPSVMTVAEESTAFPRVTGPVSEGGLGFTFKWNMGWMHDMLDYMSADPLFRKGRHNELTFTMTYAFSEHFVLPLSHDEVVHGKRSLLNKMSGSYEEKFQNLRTFYGYMMTHPGKKLLFMGGEFGQFIEWDFQKQLDWLLLDYEKHCQLRAYVRDLNRFYLAHDALWDNDDNWDGFRWIACDDADHSVIAYRRVDRKGREMIVVCNFCPVLRENYCIGAPQRKLWKPVLSSDDAKYGGAGTTLAPVMAQPLPMHGLKWSLPLTLPPLSTVIYM